MDGINRTGGQDAAAIAAAKQQLQRLADETAKYTLPGLNAVRSGAPDQPRAPTPPQNLAALRQWVEQHPGGIDVIA